MSFLVNPSILRGTISASGANTGLDGIYNQDEMISIAAFIDVCSGSLSWAGPNGFTSEDVTPIEIGNATSANAGVYTVTLTSPNSCTASATINILVYDEALYADDAGSDSNTGNDANPLATIQKAIDVSLNGYTIIVKDGS